jgi:hypothetical protein
MTMPRVDADSSCGGLRVPGLYAALLERERGYHERRGGRRVYADPEDPWRGFFQLSEHLLNALEAGEPAVFSGHKLGGRGIPKVPLSAEQKDWPNYYTVTPDDLIVAAEYPVVDPIRPPRGSGND